MKKKIMVAIVLIVGYGLGLNYVIEQKSVESQENVKNEVTKASITEDKNNEIMGNQII